MYAIRSYYGSTGGGETVTISGTDLVGTTAVTFGGVVAPITSSMGMRKLILSELPARLIRNNFV